MKTWPRSWLQWKRWRNILSAIAALPRQIQENFLDAYNVSQSDAAILRVFKMKALLGMFAQGRTVKESALRKKVMWANVMKKFINQAAQRSMSPAAA